MSTSKRPWTLGSTRGSSLGAALVAAPVLLSSACDSGKSGTAASTSPASTGPTSGTSTSGTSALPTPIGSRWPRPSGPQFAILAGQGIGPIRLRAKLSTVERHMELACPARAPGVCRYAERGAEFFLDGEDRVERMHLHRVGRRVAGTQMGIFNGAIPPDLQFGMLPEAVMEGLGKPTRVIQGDAGAYPGTVEQHEYAGMVLEYDRMPSGQLVLSGIRIPK